MKKLLSNKAYIAVFVAPGLILFLVMAVIPLFTTGYYGLFNYDGIGEKVFIGLKNYKELFTTDPYFLRSHYQKVKALNVTLKDRILYLVVDSARDVSLELGLLKDKKEFFEEVFGIRLVMRRKGRR